LFSDPVSVALRGGSAGVLQHPGLHFGGQQLVGVENLYLLYVNTITKLVNSGLLQHPSNSSSVWSQKSTKSGWH